MARFYINIGQATFYVEKVDPIDTGDGDLYCYDIFATNGDSITITLSGSASNAFYIANGSISSTPFTSPVTVTYAGSLRVCFYLGATSIAGSFNSAGITIVDNTIITGYNTYNDQVTAMKDTTVPIINTGGSDFTSGALNILAGIDLVINTGLASISDVSVYDTAGNDLSFSFETDITGGTITLKSNNNVSNIIVKAIGS